MIHVRNPRTGEFDYTIEPLTQEALTERAQSMRIAQDTWRQKSMSERIETLTLWQRKIEDKREAIIEALTKDTGRYNESILEADWVPQTIQRWADWALDYERQKRVYPSAVPNIQIENEDVPYSLVSVISPWNFPLLLSLIDTIPALLAGAAVIVKPSEVTPRFADIIQETIQECPELSSVFCYVQGDGHTGQQLIDCTDLCCFTGSVATGQKVYQQAAQQFKPCFLELGGKDAALVLEGADLHLAARSILWGSTVNSGHSCLSIERVYVDQAVAEEFLSLLQNEATKVQMAENDPRKGHIGPIISDRQVPIINSHLEDALDKGAKLETGSPSCYLSQGGYYCRPTVLTGVDHEMKIMKEETFGPLIPVMTFETVDEAIRLANDTIFGLSGAVFAASAKEAKEVARHIEAGAISINECALTALVHDGAKNSFKMSGLGGSRMGASSLKRFMRKKAYLINTRQGPSPWWYTY